MLDFLLTLIIIMNISLMLTLARLKLKHDEVFVRLDLNKTTFGSPKQLAIIIEFIIKRKYAELKDSLLTCVGLIFAVSFPVVIVFMFTYVLQK